MHIYIYIYMYYIISDLAIMSVYVFSGLYHNVHLMYSVYVLCFMSAVFCFVSTGNF